MALTDFNQFSLNNPNRLDLTADAMNEAQENVMQSVQALIADAQLGEVELNPGDGITIDIADGDATISVDSSVTRGLLAGAGVQLGGSPAAPEVSVDSTVVRTTDLDNALDDLSDVYLPKAPSGTEEVTGDISAGPLVRFINDGTFGIDARGQSAGVIGQALAAEPPGEVAAEAAVVGIATSLPAFKAVGATGVAIDCNGKEIINCPSIGGGHGPWRRVGDPGEPTLNAYWSGDLYFREAPGGVEVHGHLTSGGFSPSSGLADLCYFGDVFTGFTGRGSLAASIVDWSITGTWQPGSIYISEWLDFGAVIPADIQFGNNIELVFSGFLPLRAT